MVVEKYFAKFKILIRGGHLRLINGKKFSPTPLLITSNNGLCENTTTSTTIVNTPLLSSLSSPTRFIPHTFPASPFSCRQNLILEHFQRTKIPFFNPLMRVYSQMYTSADRY